MLDRLIFAVTVLSALGAGLMAGLFFTFSAFVMTAFSRIAPSAGINVIRLPEHYGPLSPILHTVPLQLLAYHAALARGTDVDKPRNLAKSVTVE